MTKKGAKLSEWRRSRERSGHLTHLPPSDVICEIFDALQRGEAPSLIRTRYDITENSIYRYRRRGWNWRPHLKARWWAQNRERVCRMLGRGRNWKDIWVRLAPPRELFSSSHALRDHAYREEIREIEFRSTNREAA